MKATVFCSVGQSCLTPCDPMDCTCQVRLSMGFPRHEYWSGLPFLSLGDLPDPGIKPGSPALQADSLPSEPSKFKIFSFNFTPFYLSSISFPIEGFSSSPVILDIYCCMTDYPKS